MPPERRVVLGDAADGVSEPPLHVQARALHVRRRLSIASAQPDRRRELLRHRLELLARAARAPGIAHPLGFGELIFEVLDAPTVGLLGPVVAVEVEMEPSTVARGSTASEDKDREGRDPKARAARAVRDSR
jgi:hypothetical protein